MPLKLPSRSRSTKVKSPSASTSSRYDSLHRSSSTAAKSSALQHSTSASHRTSTPPDRLRSRRSQSHESQDRRPQSSSSYQQQSHPRPDDRNNSHHRGADYSPSRSRQASPKRGRERPPLSTWGRRDSNSAPYLPYHPSRPLSGTASPRDDRSPQRFSRREEPDNERRGRSSSVRQLSPQGPNSREPQPAHHHESPSSLHVGGTSDGTRSSHLRRPESEDRRGHTPERYRPSPLRHHSSPHSRSRSRSGRSSKSPNKHDTEPAAEEGGFFARLPGRLASYAGFHAISENADKAKEWIDYLKDLQGTPSEIHDLSAKAYTARDTITQIQKTLAARPDLLEGESGRVLRGQIEETIESADGTLVEMTKMLKQLTTEGTQQGAVMRGLEQYWNGHRYRNEYEAKVKETDDKLQGELQQLSTLMVNVYSRALRKPPPPGLSGNIPPPAPQSSGTPPIIATPPTTATGHASAEGSQRVRHHSPTQPAGGSPAGVDSTQAKTAKDEPSPAQPQPSIPIVEVQPPTQTSDGDGDNPESPLQHLSPHSTTLHDLQYTDCSPLLTPDRASLPTDDDDQSVGDGLLPVARDPQSPRAGSAQPLQPEAKPAAQKSPDQTPSGDAGQTNGRHNSTETLQQKPSPSQPQQQDQTQTDPQTQPQAQASSQKSYFDPQVDRQQTVQQLLDAAWFGDIEGVTKSLRLVSPNVSDSHGLTPLHLACQRDHLAIAILLIDGGASPSALASNERQPIHLAARYGSCATVEMLLEKAHADPNARTQDGRTPLHFAASSAEEGDEDRREVIRVLRDWGADPEVRNGKGETPRETAQERGYWRAAGVLRRMEKRREEARGGRRGSSAGNGSSPHGGPEEKKGNWLQRHGLMK